MSATLPVSAPLYDGVYAHRLTPTILDRIDAQALGCPEAAALRCLAFLTGRDLVRYRRIFARGIGRLPRTVQPPTLLDLGCGFGGLGRWLAGELGTHLLGIDFSPVAIAGAQASVTTAEAGRVRFVTAPFTSIDLPGGAVAAVSLDGLYLADEPHAAVAELRRVLAPGAPLVFTAFTEPSAEGASASRLRVDWPALLRADGFSRVRVRDISAPWCAYMRRKHTARWRARARIRAELGQQAEAELSVSVAMLGLDGRQPFPETVRRLEVTATRGR